MDNICISQLEKTITIPKVSCKCFDNEFNEWFSYTIFNDTLYNEEVFIDSVSQEFPTLSINIPYKYYKGIKVPEKINKLIEYRPGYRSLNPIFARINKGSITASNLHGYISILLAKHFVIPTIPVTLYMPSENVVTSDDGLCIDSSKYICKQENIQLINSICNPYFLFQTFDKNEKNIFRKDKFKVDEKEFYEMQYHMLNPVYDDGDICDRHLRESVTSQELSQYSNDNGKSIEEIQNELRVIEVTSLNELFKNIKKELFEKD